MKLLGVFLASVLMCALVHGVVHLLGGTELMAFGASVVCSATFLRAAYKDGAL